MRVTRAQFEGMAEAALRQIPRRFLNLIVDLEISVKAAPGPEAGKWQGSRILGIYMGLRRSDMGSPYSGTHPPARIILYQRNIEALCPNRKTLARHIRLTLRHELAHHFGFTDQDLKEKWPEGV